MWDLCNMSDTYTKNCRMDQNLLKEKWFGTVLILTHCSSFDTVEKDY